jgi:hypothetical protein
MDVINLSNHLKIAGSDKGNTFLGDCLNDNGIIT